MTISPITRASVLGAAHLLADCTSGFLGASLLISLSASSNFIVLLLTYNIIAFALQPAFGALIDRFSLHRQTSIWSLAIFALGLFISLFSLPVGFLIVAPASALFHVSAGSLATIATPNRPLGAGLFTAPGVFGLALGTIAGLLSFSITPILIGLLFFIAIMIVHTAPAPHALASVSTPRIASASIITALILLIAFRSAAWVGIGTENYSIGLIIALASAAALGKLAGGLFGDSKNITLLTALSLALSGILLSTHLPGALLIGVFFLQFSTPLLLWFLVTKMTRNPGLATGLVLGLGIFLGGLLTRII